MNNDEIRTIIDKSDLSTTAKEALTYDILVDAESTEEFVSGVEELIKTLQAIVEKCMKVERYVLS